MKMPFFKVSSIAIVVPMSHPLPWNDPYVMHFVSATIYSRELKFLQVIYENFDCDLTQGFFLFVISINK